MSATTETDWTMQLSEGGEVYPFVESDNADITGLGHQDKAEFAAAVNRYDAECNGDDWVDEADPWTADYVGHAWVLVDRAAETLYWVDEGTPGATAVTTLWGQR